jgi:ribonuclease E
MTKRILVDAVHPEEIRVAVADDAKLVEFDFESHEKKQIKSNIYLGKITRVEPSLQAAFVEYGGNRQGFLPFSEIHFDYFQIPTEDKEKLHKAMEADRKKQEEKENFAESKLIDVSPMPEKVEQAIVIEQAPIRKPYEFVIPEGFTEKDKADLLKAEELAKKLTLEIMGEEYYNQYYGIVKSVPVVVEAESFTPEISKVTDDEDDMEEENSMSKMQFYKQYKIQEVIKRNQIVLVQIVKEERGTKGASLTTYMAVAGRYCVFMPNTDKGGGVSRRISNFTDRKRVRDIMKQLNSPEGTSVIIRTAGVEKELEEVKKDYDYLLTLWDNIRKQTMQSSAPALIYEESDIVKRSLRDMLKADVSEVIIEGEETFKSAKKFMEIIGSNQLDLVKEYKGKMPIFQKFRIEEKLDELYETEIKLESGGSIVITPTEALVAIDVNSGKSTGERNVEDTALKTNTEAAREIARQLKLRDLAGLVVIDFIDMREVRNRKAIERELKDALKNDRAKIQIGRISAFGLLEMSRQRLRSSIVESSSSRCPMCKGIGVVRTVESLTLKALRALESEAGRKSVKEINLRASQAIAHNLENHRKKEIQALEKEMGVKISIEVDTLLLPNQFELSTQKYSSRKPNESEVENKSRPQQQVVKNMPQDEEAKIDADVDEQLSAWKTEVANVEKLPARKFDRNADRGDRKPRHNRDNRDKRDGSERRDNGPRRDNREFKEVKDFNSETTENPSDGSYVAGGSRPYRQGGGRGPRREDGNGGPRHNNRNNRNGKKGGGQRRNGEKSRYNYGYDNNDGGYQQNNFVQASADNSAPKQYNSPENIERIDSKPKPDNKFESGNQQASVDASKQPPSKLVGLWKKITS